MILICAVACGGRTNEAPPDGGGGGGEASDGGSGSSSIQQGPSSFTSADVQAALAHCGEPHGPAFEVTTPNDEKANLSGSWILCPSSADAGATTMFAPAIWLGANGSFQTLAVNADGGLDPEPGVRTQGTWTTGCDVSSGPSDPCSHIVVRMDTTGGDQSPDGCFGGSISFESSPRRMYVLDSPKEWCSAASAVDDFDMWLVPLQ